MDLDTIAEWIADKETLPWGRAAILGLYACIPQYDSQFLNVGTLEPEVPLYIWSQTGLFHGEMNVQSTGIKPHAAADTKGLRLRDLTQTKNSRIERARNVLAAFRHGEIDVGKVHNGSPF